MILKNYFLLLIHLECPQAPLLLASCLGNLSLVWINLFVSLDHHIFSEGTISPDTAAQVAHSQDITRIGLRKSHVFRHSPLNVTTYALWAGSHIVYCAVRTEENIQTMHLISKSSGISSLINCFLFTVRGAG